jgi:cytidylate kinase
MSRSIEQLVDQQVLRWLAERQIADRPYRMAPRPSQPPVAEHQRPVICVSREFGALGGEIGRITAARLEFAFYAQELVDEIAKQAHVRRKVVESLDERRRTGIARWIDELVRIGRFTPTDYMHNLSAVVLTLGRHGKSVIVGRGAFLLLDPALTLRVRCHAPLEWRVERAAKTHGLSEFDARAMVVRIDRERTTFYRENFKVEVSDPQHFDMFLNPSTTGVEECAELLLSAFQARFGPDAAARRPSGRERSAEVSAASQATAGGV